MTSVLRAPRCRIFVVAEIDDRGNVAGRKVGTRGCSIKTLKLYSTRALTLTPLLAPWSAAAAAAANSLCICHICANESRGRAGRLSLAWIEHRRISLSRLLGRHAKIDNLLWCHRMVAGGVIMLDRRVVAMHGV